MITLIVLATIFMGYEASRSEVSYTFTGLVPRSDSSIINYDKLKTDFGTSDNIILIATEDSSIFQLEKLKKFQEFTKRLKKVNSVDSVFSIVDYFILTKDTVNEKFTLNKALKQALRTQNDADSVKHLLHHQPFYEGLLWKKENSSTAAAITINADSMNTSRRIKIILNVEKEILEFGKTNNIKFHFSGLPYVRSKVAAQVEDEIVLFLILSSIITSLILFFFVRSLKAVLLSMLIVGIAVLWSFGSVPLFGYKLTLLSSLIPALIVVLGIPNCIFMLNKYFEEYKNHGNKIKGIHRVIQRIGTAMFMINLTTALGFATFAFTNCAILVEFGIIAAINIMVLYVLCIVIVPIAYSYFKEPTEKDFRHQEKKWMQALISKISLITEKRKMSIYLTTIIICAICTYGITLIKPNGKVVDEIPNDHPVKVDLHFFEENFNGIIPLEILVDTKIKGKARNEKTWSRIQELYDTLYTYPEVTKVISLIDVLKYSKQSLYNGNHNEYSLPESYDLGLLKPFFENSTGNKNVTSKFVDSAYQTLRITAYMKDVPTARVQEIQKSLYPKIDSIFNPQKYNVSVTGTSIIYAKGTDLLIENLYQSIVFAILVISIFIAYSFRSFKMVIIALIPNIIPLIITAGIMGFYGIPLKISTLLTFSIAFGITVDNTIHFLDRYKYELKRTPIINIAVSKALKATGISIFYTSLVLFFGFLIFTQSSFGGTVALGFLLSLTLLTGMICNIVVLPATLLTLEKNIQKKERKKEIKAIQQ